MTPACLLCVCLPCRPGIVGVSCCDRLNLDDRIELDGKVSAFSTGSPKRDSMGTQWVLTGTVATRRLCRKSAPAPARRADQRPQWLVNAALQLGASGRVGASVRVGRAVAVLACLFACDDRCATRTCCCGTLRTRSCRRCPPALPSVDHSEYRSLQALPVITAQSTVCSSACCRSFIAALEACARRSRCSTCARRRPTSIASATTRPTRTSSPQAASTVRQGPTQSCPSPPPPIRTAPDRVAPAHEATRWQPWLAVQCDGRRCRVGVRRRA